MHEVDFQNWLNHARSVGYTDTEIRTLLLKAGWSYQQVNAEMTRRGMEPGSALPGPRGHIIKHAPIHPATLAGIILIIIVAIVSLATLLFILLQ